MRKSKVLGTSAGWQMRALKQNISFFLTFSLDHRSQLAVSWTHPKSDGMGREVTTNTLQAGPFGDSTVAALVDAVHDAVVEVDESGVITAVNAVARQQMELLRGMQLFDGDPGESLALARALTSGQPTPFRHTDGLAVQRAGRLIPIANSSPARALAVIIARESQTDLAALRAELEQTTAQLEALSRVDALTGLANRYGLEQILFSEFNRARRTGTRMVALLVDYRHLRHLNAARGQVIGDLVLKEIALRLREATRGSDHLARVGGDEFLVLLPETRVAEAAHLRDKLAARVQDRPVYGIGEPVKVEVTVATIEVPDEAYSLEEILTLGHAEVQQLRRAPQGGLAEKNEFLALLQAKPLRVVQQSIVDLADETEIARELLIRGPIGRFESPEDLFFACESHDLLTYVDLRCLTTCIEAVIASEQTGAFHLNLFPSTLLCTPTERIVEALVKGVSRQDTRFCIELSEQQFIGDPGILKRPIEALRANGFRIAIDDVGFGRSSLEAMVILEPTMVKVDRLWISGISNDVVKRQWLSRLLRLAAAIDATLVAEGVESEADARTLRDLGVKFAQGFLWSRPAPLAQQDIE